MSIAVSAVAALIAGALWQPGVGLLRGSRPRWLIPLIPMITAGGLAMATTWFFEGFAAQLAVSLWAAGSAWLGVIDAAEHHLPWRLTLPITGALIGLFAIQSALDGSAQAWGRAVVSMVVVTGVLFALAWWSGGRLGLGDVALGMPVAVLLGWLGWGVVLRGLAMGFVLGGLVALVALMRGRGRGAEVPFGPSLVIGAVLGAWLGVAA